MKWRTEGVKEAALEEGVEWRTEGGKEGVEEGVKGKRR